MIKNKITIAIFSLFFVGACIHSNEAFSQTSQSSDVKSTEGVLTQIGSPSGVLEPLKGFAKDIPLITVMRQITPDGWVVKKSENESNKLNTDMLVSWNGGGSWVETLGNLVKGYPLNANVNWYKKEITLMPVENKAVAKTMIFELENNHNVSTQIAAGGSGQVKEEEKKVAVVTPVASSPVAPVVVAPTVESVAPVIAVAPVAVVPVVVAPVVVAPVEQWSLDSKSSLKENVVQWGTKAGYRVVWLGEDYPLDNTRVLTGAFDKEDGPVKQLAIDYGPKSRVQQPLSFQFFQNATLVVENWRFEQAGYPQHGSAQ